MIGVKCKYLRKLGGREAESLKEPKWELESVFFYGNEVNETRKLATQGKVHNFQTRFNCFLLSNTVHLSNMDSSSRSESFESIPEVDFLRQIVNDELDSVNKSLVSDFKKLEMSGKLQPEPLLTADKSRFVLFPIKHNDVSNLVLLRHL